MAIWPEHIQFIMDELSSHGHEVFAVGGCVRDMMQGKQPQDYDLVSSAAPTQISAIFSRVFTVGAAHGTVVVMIDQWPVEVSTYRYVALEPSATALERDLAGRDFTINAMAMDVKGNLYDPWGGEADLNAGLVQATRDQGESLFVDDPLRMMRAIRFAVVYGFEIAASTYTAILKGAHLLAEISRERVRNEFNAIITSAHPAEGVRKLQASGLMAYIIPELEDLQGFDQKNYRHDKDVLEHSLAVLEEVPAQLDVRLAALLHDIGKPACFTVDQRGIGHFYNHHQTGMDITRRILNRLKYDGKTIENVSRLVGSHMTRYAKLRQSSLKQLIQFVGEDNLSDLYELQRADILGSAPPFDFSELEKMRQDIDFILDTKQPLTIKDLAVNGDDLIALGYTPGKPLGDTLRRLWRAVLENPADNNREILLQWARVWLDQLRE